MNSSPRIRVMLVDDHFFVRIGFAASLNCESDLQVVAEASNGDEALRLFREHRPDVTFLDLALGATSDGVTVLRTIRAEFSDARVVILSASELEEDVFRAMSAGACGYLPKSAERVDVLKTIRLVHGGEQYIHPDVARRLETRNSRPKLSPREQAVLERIVAGESNKEIAWSLQISEFTVRQYVSALLVKLGAQDRVQATTIAVKRGLVRLS